MSTRRGRYIVLEGIESSGKSTQRDLLDGRLQAAGIPVRFIREPAGDALGRAIRKLFLDPQYDIDPRTEVFLMSAARSSLMRGVAQLLEQGVWVVSLRNFLSTLAYQGAGREVDINLKDLRHICTLSTRDVPIDLGILLDGAPEVFAHREPRRPPGHRLDNLNLEFMTRARQSYLDEGLRYGFIVLDATRHIETTQTDIWSLLEPLIDEYVSN
jgi:dTMP kinase